jgi:hypothetical protein
MHQSVNLYRLCSSIGSMLGFLIIKKAEGFFWCKRHGAVLIITHHIPRHCAGALVKQRQKRQRVERSKTLLG